MNADVDQTHQDGAQTFAPESQMLLLPEHNDHVLESIDFNAYGTSDEDLQF